MAGEKEFSDDFEGDVMMFTQLHGPDLNFLCTNT